MYTPNLAKFTAALTLLFLPLSAPANADDEKMVQFDQIEWVNWGNTNVQFSILWGSREKGPYAMYLKLPAGFNGIAHSHSGDYHGYTLQGEWKHRVDGVEVVLPVGSYVFQPGKDVHSDACVGNEDCILLIHQDTPGDFIPHQS